MNVTEKMIIHDMEAHFALSGAPVLLKAGEKHCPFCDGYGWNPSAENNGDAIRCGECGGTGLLAQAALDRKPKA